MSVSPLMDGWEFNLTFAEAVDKYFMCFLYKQLGSLYLWSCTKHLYNVTQVYLMFMCSLIDRWESLNTLLHKEVPNRFIFEHRKEVACSYAAV